MYNNSYPTDPFGWRGSEQDPLVDYSGETASCLWVGAPGDDISCGDIIVEDDGNGWSQSGWWGESEAGNGARQHWTNVWDEVSAYVRWTPPSYYPGSYQVYAFIPSANSTTNNASYEVYSYPDSEVHTINQNNPANTNFWASLGTHNLVGYDWVYLNDYTGEIQNSRQIAADAMKFSAGVVYLPDVRNASGWLSSINIRNHSITEAKVTINYYNTSGGYVFHETTTVAAQAMRVKTPPAGFYGSAVVVTSEDVSVVMENEDSGHDERTNYTGVLPGGPGSLGWEQTGTTLSVPTIKRQYYGRSSSIHVTNVGHGSTGVDVYYYDSNGNYRLGASFDLASNEKEVFTPSGSGNGCGSSGTVCSAKLVADNGQPLAGVVREYNDADGKAVTTHNLFSSGATSIHFPVVKYNYYDMSTGLRIQNVGSADTDITVSFYRKDGTEVCTLSSNNTSSFAAHTFFDSNCPGNNFVGSAVATANRPLVGMANEVGLGQKKAYSSYQGGSHTVYGPLVYHDYGSWDAGIAVHNLSDQNASVDLRYYHHTSGYPAGSQLNQTIAAHGMEVFFAPQTGFKGSVLITADEDIVAVVNVVNTAGGGDAEAIYNASNR